MTRGRTERLLAAVRRSHGDLRTLAAPAPCIDCPFRRGSVAGYLGGFTLDTYAQPTETGLPTSCHHRDLGLGNETTRFCAGSLAAIANDPAVEPLPGYGLITAGRGSDEVFGTVAEFREYHRLADELAHRGIGKDR